MGRGDDNPGIAIGIGILVERGLTLNFDQNMGVGNWAVLGIEYRHAIGEAGRRRRGRGSSSCHIRRGGGNGGRNNRLTSGEETEANHGQPPGLHRSP